MKIITEKDAYEGRKGESGNVLFLILIAVALFAALSYAVTQSSRSGGSGAEREVNLIGSAQITQYPSSLRTAIVRMLVSGVSAEQILFNTSDTRDGYEYDFSGLVSPDDTQNFTNRGVFHPNGGGASFIQPSPDVMAGANQGVWYFNGNFGIEGIGTDQAELIAFLPGISEGICRRLNQEYGITGIPEADGVVLADIEQSRTGDVANTGAVTIDPTPAFVETLGEADVMIGSAPNLGGAALAGQPFGCFLQDDTPNLYVYYHVLVER